MGSRTLWIVWLIPLLEAQHPCAPCHREIVQRHAASRHANALKPFETSQLASLLQAAPVTEKDGYAFAYAEGRVTAAKGADTATGSLDWTFGSGLYAMTAMGRVNRLFFEHRISHYTAPGRVGITPGQALGASPSAIDALGIIQSPADAYRCFNCHATGVERDDAGGPLLDKMTPGVQCDRCHGPGEAHVAAKTPQSIFNSGRLPAKASVEFCGGCHRIARPGQELPEPELEDPVSIRFQPVGLVASRCFKESRRLTCTTCHDPHTNTGRLEPVRYMTQCLGCHTRPAKATAACRRNQRQDCLPCHMQRATPLPFLTFTDHRIRIY